MNRGFTLIELLVAASIFAFMTALVVAKYGTFNQSVLLTNLAYDVAITIRTAQTYGLSVKSSSDSTPIFDAPYGVEFSTSGGGQTIMFYTDLNGNGVYDTSGAEKVSSYAIKRGAVISAVCAGSGSCSPGTGRVDILFKRPDPNAIICSPGNGCSSSNTYSLIVVKGTDGSTRKVEVRQNGQISVLE